MTRVLTFSTNISAGHRRGAEAVSKALLSFDPDASILEKDAMEVMGSRRGRFLSDAYLGILRYRPTLWNSLYQNKSISGKVERFFEIFFARAAERFEAEIDLHNPDVIVCTQAIPARIIADLKRRNRCDAPILAVATDYGIHPYWADEEIDMFAVSSEDARAQLIRDGISKERIVVTGIPVDTVFEAPPSRSAARSRLGLKQDGRYVLMMGGGNGLGITPGDVSAVERTAGVDGVLIVTGSNNVLHEKVLNLPCGDATRRVFSQVDRIEDFYAAVDALVSKPGGLTMAEATALRVPIVMVSPLPGQEVGNAQFLSSVGAALSARGGEELQRRIASIFSDDDIRKGLTAAAARIGRPGASREIARLARTLAENPARDNRDSRQERVPLATI